MNVIVCGGSNISVKSMVCNSLNKVDQKDPITMLITGGGLQGAERFAREWAEKRGIPVEEYFADAELHGKRARGVRDVAMLDFGQPDLIVAFSVRTTPSLSGLLRRAAAQGIPVFKPYQ